MVVCKNCGSETEAANYCGFCGQPLLDSIIEENNKSFQVDITEQKKHRIPFNDNQTNTQQNTFQNTYQQNTYQNNQYINYQHGNYQQQNSQQGSYNNDYNRGYNYQQTNTVHYPKSQFLGIFLSIIIPGLGHIYVGKTVEGIILIVVWFILLILSFLIVPALIAFVIWIYAIIKTNDMIEKYNNGLPY